MRRRAPMRDPATHDYPTNHGTNAFREAVASFYRDRFGVDLEADGEIVPVLGGKEGVSHVALACLDPGDLCLAPDPGYPPYTSGPLFAGSEPYYLPLREKNGFLPDLDSIPEDVLARANLLFLNYPNNPTGAIVREGYFERGGRVRPRQRPDRRPRQRVLGDLLRGLPRAELPRDARREGRRRRDLLAVQGLEHDRLALRAHGGQRRDRRALPAAEDEHRLGHVRGDAGRRRGGADGGARLSGGDVAPSTSAAATWSRTRCARSASTSHPRSPRRTSGRASRTDTRREASPSSSSSGRRSSSRRVPPTGRTARDSSGSRSRSPTTGWKRRFRASSPRSTGVELQSS